MSYSDFLNNLSYSFNLLISTLTAWVSNLLTNYFFITILGVGLFISFVLFVVDHFIFPNISRSKDYKDNQYN